MPEEEYRRDNGYGRTVGPSKSAIVVWIVRNIIFSGHARRVEALLYEKSSVEDSPSGYDDEDVGTDVGSKCVVWGI